MCLLVGLIILVYVFYRVYQHLFPSPDINPRDKYVLISGCDTGFGNGLAIENLEIYVLITLIVMYSLTQ
ncbi:unnamed protein product [Rotaria sordida]|uniref:Uncharacterized protein n=1 Tax=Rotaria sordida TaxID=392033 RepID=A0A814SCC8_9BILA|nr:unnamed protein product [Rotaria sordida]